MAVWPLPAALARPCPSSPAPASSSASTTVRLPLRAARQIKCSRASPRWFASAPWASRRRASFPPPSRQMSYIVSFTSPPCMASSRSSRSALRAGRSNWSTRSCVMPAGTMELSGSPPPSRVCRQQSWKRLPRGRRSPITGEGARRAAEFARGKIARVRTREFAVERTSRSSGSLRALPWVWRCVIAECCASLPRQSSHPARPPLQDDFKAAAEEAKTLPSNLSNDDQARSSPRAPARSPPPRRRSPPHIAPRLASSSWRCTVCTSRPTSAITPPVRVPPARPGGERDLLSCRSSPTPQRRHAGCPSHSRRPPPARPGFLDMKGKAKWDAWTAKKGASAAPARGGRACLCGRAGAHSAQAWRRRMP